MPELSQKNRIGVLKTPLGEDVVVLNRLEAREGISELFEFTITALSNQDAIDFDAAIGRNCSVKVRSFEDVVRYFNGVLADTEWTGVQDGLFCYRLVLRPWLWILTHTSDCRIFHKMSVTDIIKDVFSKAGFSDFEFKTTRSYDPIEYCVQYRETSFAFVSRLMEEFGIYYFFEHTEDQHKMILADSQSAHQPIASGGKLPFIALSGSYVREDEHLQTLTSARRFRSGKFTVNDYDFEKPNKKLVADSSGNAKYAKGQMEVYDYPGRYTEMNKGEFFAKVRLEAEQALDNRRIATGEAVSIYPGGKFELTHHASASENQTYLALRANHTVVDNGYFAGASSAEAEGYYGTYEIAPLSQPFRAPLLTPKPRIYGVQTAKVIGDEGEEITVDKYGRIKVKFHWDRENKGSCWMRVAEMWSGKNWGTVFHPRHGQEVVVDFLEGDPDQPLCVGTVYNGDNMVPYDLPANKTMGGVKSDSTKGGGGYNEFVFEDKKGSEKIRMHAEKDHEVVIKHAETIKIGETFEIPKGSPSREHTIINGDDKLTVQSGDQNVKIAQDRKMDVGMNHNVTIGMNHDEKVGMSQSSTIGMSRSATVTMSDSVTAGMSISLTATASITLTCGPTSLMLSPAGITIMAPTMQVLGTANVTVLAPTILMQGAGMGMIPYPGMTLALT